MPNVRLMRRPVTDVPTTVRLRPLLAIGGITRNQTGTAVLSQAGVRAFRALNDVLAARSASDSSGYYNVSTPDTAAYYAVAIQDGTFDTTDITWDNTHVTFDRTQSVGGVSTKPLLGTS